MSTNNGSGSGRSLLPHHREMLEASSIAEDVAAERGYFSVEQKRELEQLGFGRTQQLVPALVIPIHGVVAGEAPWFIHRPDEPRVKDGRPRKYEIPARRKMSLDIHPRVRGNLANPALPLFITEGSKKADALITAGARAVIGVIGVWNWRGRNDGDGLALLPDWEWVALKEGRQVYVVYDSDILLKQPVALAMNRMGAALRRMGASVAYTRLPSGDDGAKVGADDFLAARHTLDDIVALSTGTPPEPPSMSVAPSGGSEQRAQVHKAPELAYEPDLLDRFIRDLRRLGHIGEETASKLVYLSATSRLLTQIVSIVLKGPSAAGKSATVDRALRFFPDEAIVSLSGMSERFLVYDDRPIKHRMLILHEAAGMSGEYATYLIRTLLSEGCLRHGTVESTPEGLRPMMIVREGPAGLITSTTQVNLHAENETRLLSIPVDDTREHTKAVMGAIARNNGLAVDMSDWHTLQYWLADGERRVEVPFAEKLADLIPPLTVRLRRDFGSLLALVRAHALLHRATREIDEHKGVIATVDDYAAVRELVVDVISDGIGAQVTKATRETVEAVADIVASGDQYATNAQLAERLEIDRSAVYRRVTKAISQGYLLNDEDRPRKPTKLKIGEPLPGDQVILPERECVAGLCTCASHSDPPHTPTDIGGRPDDGADRRAEAFARHPSAHNGNPAGAATNGTVLATDQRMLADLSDSELLAAFPGSSFEPTIDSLPRPRTLGDSQ
jgi:Domain of unknown function (DUF3854)